MMNRSYRILRWIGLWTVSACASLGLPWGNDDTAALLRQPLPTDSQAIIDTLPNGLRYFVRENAEPDDRAELRLVVNAGSVLEDADQRGLAHFVEHMAFNGTRSFEKQELVDYLETIGMRFGPDVNAYTSFDETVYLLTVPTDTVGALETGLQILREWATEITFDSLEVEKERGVVIEEWRLGQGAAARMREEQFPVLFRRSRYADRLPIGTKSSLENFDHAALKRFYQDWYRPDLMAVVVVGEIDEERVAEMIREQFGDIPPAERSRSRREYGVPSHRETLVSVATDPEASASTVSLYLKKRPTTWRTVGDYRQWLIESLASSMLNNRLTEHTQRPDAPFLDVSSFQGRFLRPLSAFVLNARVRDGGVEQGLEALLREFERVTRYGFTPAELEREKAETLRMIERQYAERDKSHSGGYAAEYVSHFLYGGAMLDVSTRYELARKLMPTIDAEDVNGAVGAWERNPNRVILVNAPDKEGVPAPDEERLAEAVEAIRRQRVSAYVDEMLNAPLVSELPEPSGVVNERVIPDAEILEWTLANGVRVLLKPTDFRNDEVLLAGRSPGGTSRVSDEDYIAALTSSAAVQVGGVGEFNLIELQKRLAGKAASVGTNISELHETVSGAASPKDIETMFQLVYLKFTAPRMDTVAFEAYREQARASLENRGATPESHFRDTLQVTLAQGHPRAQPPSPALFDELDLEKSMAIYRDRFADASDFTFYLVGTFDPDSIRPLVERYLGGLPSLGRTEQWRDVGIEPPTGIVRKTVRKGMEAKARTQIVFSGPLEFARPNLYVLESLADILEIRLREVLREDLGGTYGARVSASGARDPEPEYRFGIGFGAAPDRVDELTESVWAQIDSLQVHGPTPLELAKVREMHRRSRQTRLRENNYWLSQIMTYDRYGWDLRDIASSDPPDPLTAKQIQQAAARYLRADNYVQVSLVPERAPESSEPR